MLDRAQSGNWLLDSLSDAELAPFAKHLEIVPLEPHVLIQEPGKSPEYAYFPLHGVISLMARLEDGSAVETAVVGPEGFVGTELLIEGPDAPGPTNTLAIGQVRGVALRMDPERFRAAAAQPRTATLLFGYWKAIFAQISQSVACNASHPVVQRCARWLLQTHDRVLTDSFELTQEFLADMLGVTRPAVTVAALTLQESGLIRYHRGSIEVLDRKRLEQASCECYQAVRDSYDRLVAFRR